MLTHVDDLFLVGLRKTFLTFGQVLATSYLYIPRCHPRRQIMKLTPRLTALWIDIHPEHAQYVFEDGSLYIEWSQGFWRRMVSLSERVSTPSWVRISAF